MVGRVSFKIGRAEALPVEDATVDLVWCRDVLSHVEAIESACAEFRRVLKNDGRAIVYQMFGTEHLERREAEWLWNMMGVVPNSAGPVQTEQAFGAGGLRIQKRIIIGIEFGEWAEETSRNATRRYCTLLDCFALLAVTRRNLARRLRNHAW
ncbi:MAG TPA: class I SAM-dependent methyltransferase [Dehalococcoidia bacterium]|nr:class I SAM-dependent methyltransferase [Dehalococcoidia bacterium]HIO63796.1 class I SAM-dependent methyltransferase [Dehalococcoidia bacterium]